MVHARPEETALGLRELLQRAIPPTVCWAKKRVRQGMCGSAIPQFMRQLIPRVRSDRGLIQGIIGLVHLFRPQGFRQRQLNVGKYYWRLDARFECRVLNDASCSLYNTVLLWTVGVS